MSHYAYEVQEATTLINASDYKVVEAIKAEVRTDKWRGYGWRNDVLEAESIHDIAQTFGIQLVVEEEGYRPVIYNTYVSNFFKTMIYIIAPYMTDGVIKVDDEYNIVTIRFEDGKATVWRE